MSLLLRYLAPHRKQVVALLALLFVVLGLELLNPQIIGAFINRAVVGGANELLLWLALAYLGVAALTQVAGIVEVYVATNVGLRATNRLRADLTLHCLRLDPAFHAAHPPGELIERVDGDVGRLANFFAQMVVQLLGNALLMLGILVALFVIDWRVGLTLTVVVALAIVAVLYIRQQAEPRWAAERQAYANLYGFLEERLTGTEDIRANGAVAYVMQRLAEHSRAILRKELIANFFGISAGGVTTLALAMCTAFGLLVGAYLFWENIVPIGTVYLVFNYALLLNRPVEQITRQIQELQQAGASLGRVRDLLATTSTLRDTGTQTLQGGALTVDFDEVSFSYGSDSKEERPVVLKHIDFHLPAGKVLGLLGHTGSGKTSLTRLLFRLYDPTTGAVRLNGVSARDLPLNVLRQHIGMVTQDIQLFSASVRDNLTFFDNSIPESTIVQVLDELGLREWLNALPDGLNTMLAAGGGGLSAGQAQLLAFARVFLKNPGLVILDEASSRLDPATEQRLERAIDRLLENRTAIIIAHRLTTVQRADTILILDSGQVAEYGSRAHLAADPTSRFAQLLATGLEVSRN